MLGSGKNFLARQKSLAKEEKKLGTAGSGRDPERDPRIRTMPGCWSGIRSRGRGFFFAGAEKSRGAGNPIPGHDPESGIFRRRFFFLARNIFLTQRQHLPFFVNITATYFSFVCLCCLVWISVPGTQDLLCVGIPSPKWELRAKFWQRTLLLADKRNLQWTFFLFLSSKYFS